MAPTDLLTKRSARSAILTGWLGATVVLGAAAVLLGSASAPLGWFVLLAWVVLTAAAVVVLGVRARSRARREVEARARRARNARQARLDAQAAAATAREAAEAAEAARRAIEAERAETEAARRAAEAARAALTEPVPMRTLSTWAARRAVMTHWSAAPAPSLQRFGARNRSAWAADVLALRASRGRYDLAALHRALNAAAKGAPEVFDGATLLALARLLLATEADDGDRTGRRILRYLARGGASGLSAEGRHVATELLLLAGDEESAMRLVSGSGQADYRQMLHRADLANPHLAGHGALPEREWLDLFNLPYTSQGLEPVTLRAPGATAFDRLECVPTDRVDDGPLVSVIMTCFRPDDGIRTAIRSMIRQSWRSWELLVIDDGSGPEYDRVLAEAAAMDRRVRVIRSAENHGTYFQRNEGIRRAFGEYVTMHDSDDWAHPRRLEVQVRHLEANPRLVANVTSSHRVSDDLAYVQPRGATLRLTETSLLFRRRTVVERIGYYDDVRKAADSEFRLRIEAAFGERVPVLDLPAPLMLVRYSQTSLTGTDFGDGWVHSARVAYKSGWLRWHARISAGEVDPVVQHPQDRRRFPANEYIRGVPTPERALDVVVVADFRGGANVPGAVDRLTDDIERLAAEHAVGIAQVDSVSTSREAALLPDRLQDLVSDGRIVQLHDEDRATAALVVVASATVLTGIAPQARNVRADRTIIVEDDVAGRDVAGSTFVRKDVEAVAEAAFGVAPEVRLASTVDLGALSPEQQVGQTGTQADVAAAVELDDVAPIAGEIVEPTSFAAAPETQLALVARALELPRGATVVELGSGHSTVRLAAALAHSRPDVTLVSLDHDAHYASETLQMLEAAGVAEHARVLHAPLEPFEFDGETFPWYARSAWEPIDRIDLLFVDGPPAAVRVHSRWPALPLLAERLGPGSLIAVDDADRSDERSVLDEWSGRIGLAEQDVVGRTAFFRVEQSGVR